MEPRLQFANSAFFIMVAPFSLCSRDSAVRQSFFHLRELSCERLDFFVTLNLVMRKQFIF